MEVEAIERAVGPMFFGGLFVLFALESLAPLRVASKARLRHACGNVAWVGLAIGTNAIVSSALVTRASTYVADQQVGVLHQLPVTSGGRILLGVFVVELAGWPLHWLKHRIPSLWRFHRVHHSDSDLDVTSAFRFHPAEMTLNACWLAVSILLLGVPRTSTALLALIAIPLSLFQHANVRLPPAIDRVMRAVFVSPTVHQTHHSRDPLEAGSNYGSVFTMWDRILGTYRVTEPATIHFGTWS